MNGRDILGTASTRWNDYLGTAAADDADPFGATRSLYELAGLDRDTWWIVAIDLGVVSGAPGVMVYALRHGGPASRVTLEETIDAEGRLPVTAFRLGPSARVEDFLNEAFKRIEVRLVARGFRDEGLVVTEVTEVTEAQPA